MTPAVRKLIVIVAVCIGAAGLMSYMFVTDLTAHHGESYIGITSRSERIKQLENELSILIGQDVHEKLSRNDVTVKVSDDKPELEQDDRAPKILQKLRRKGVSYGLAGRDIAKMGGLELSLSMHSTLDQTTTICRRKLRLGHINDGGWEVCDDADVRPRRPCVVYSFGINGDFSFDDAMAEVYGCQVYSFDPSMKEETHNRSSQVHFYKIGLGGQTEVNKQGWKIYTFTDIRRLLGHEDTPIDVVKMDIEGAEWPSVRQMFQVGEMEKFKQFLLEFHVNRVNSQRLRLVQAMELAGYKVFYVHKNPARGCRLEIGAFPGAVTRCYEVHYVRRP